MYACMYVTVPLPFILKGSVLEQAAFNDLFPSMILRCWLGGRKGIRPVKTDWWGTGIFVWIEVQMICIWSSLCHCHPVISCSSKMQNDLPFWCRFTQVVLEKRPLKRYSSSSFRNFYYVLWRNELWAVSRWQCDRIEVVFMCHSQMTSRMWPTPTSEAWTSRSRKSARLLSCRSLILSFINRSASTRLGACWCSVRPAAEKRCSRKPLHTTQPVPLSVLRSDAMHRYFCL